MVSIEAYHLYPLSVPCSPSWASARRVGPGSSIFDMHMHTLSRPLVSMCLSRPLALMSLSTVAASSLSVEPLLAANGNGRMFLRDFARRAVVHEPGNWRCR